MSTQSAATQPSHDDVIAAVQRSGDRQLAILIADPGGFVLRPTELPGVMNHRVFRVMLTGTDHPTSFWLASNPNGGSATVLSQNLAGVAAFLRAEPSVWGAEDIARQFYELYRDQGLHSEILSAPSPSAERRGDGLHLRLAVRSEGRNELWKIDLPSAGAPAITVEALP